jgi:signal transduction histidine kinase
MPDPSCRRAQSAEPSDILERVSDGVVGVDREWRYTYVNESALRMLDKRSEQMLGHGMWEVFPEAVGMPIHHAAYRAMESQEVSLVEDYNPALGKWFECRLYPSSNGLSIFFHDISARRRVETLLRGQSQVLELIVNGAALAVALDALLRVIEALGTGMRCSILLLDAEKKRLHHGAAPSLPASFTEAVDGIPIGPAAGSCGTAAFMAEPVIVQDIANDSKWVRYGPLALSHGLRACWSTPILDDTRGVLGTFAMYYGDVLTPRERDQDLVKMATHLAAIAILRDRAEREREERERMRQQNRALEELNRAALEASRLKSQFLANMSHELRTPLNAINGFSEFLLDQHAGPLTPKQHECLEYVLSSGRHLLRMVSDVLDLAKVEAGKLELFPETAGLCELLGDVCAIARSLARDKEISLDWRCEPPLEQATLDVQKFKQVLFNLLANAVKFTGPGGQVWVVARALDEERFEVSVRDTGMGIEAEDVPRLFERFQQLDSGATHRHGGTGLGLALAKRLVESQGGSIRVQSKLGVGSTFSFVLPRQLAVRVSAAPPA